MANPKRSPPKELVNGKKPRLTDTTNRLPAISLGSPNRLINRPTLPPCTMADTTPQKANRYPTFFSVYLKFGLSRTNKLNVLSKQVKQNVAKK